MKATHFSIALAAAVVAAWVSGAAGAAGPEASDRAESSFTLRALPEGAETMIVNTTYVVAGTYIPGLSQDAADGTALREYDMVETAGRPGPSLVIDFPFNGLDVSIPPIDDRLAVSEATVSPGLSLKALPAP